MISIPVVFLRTEITQVWRFCLACCLLFAALPSFGTNYTWDGGGSATSTNWSTAANWNPDAVPANPFPFNFQANDGTAIFNSNPANLNSYVDTKWFISRLSFPNGAGNFILSGDDIVLGAAQSTGNQNFANIQFGAGRTVIISNNLCISTNGGASFPRRAVYMVNNSGVLNIYGNIIKSNDNSTSGFTFRGSSGGTVNMYGRILMEDNSLGKTDSSTLTINSTGNQFWGLDVAVGTVRLGVNNALPTQGYIDFGQASTATLDMNNFDQAITNLMNTVPGSAQTLATGTGTGGTLTLNDNGVTNVIQFVISGNGRINKMGNGTLTLATRNSTYVGGTTINGGVLSLGNGTGGGLLDPSGNITNNSVLIFNSTDNFGLNGALVGTGSLQKLGPSSVTLNGLADYPGSTFVGGGTLQIGASGNPSSSSAITVASGATLDISATPGLTRSSGQSLGGGGTVNGTVSALPGSSITVGGSVGTLTVSGTAALDTTTLNVELSGDPTTIGSGVNDLLDVSGTLTLTNVSTIYVSPLAPLSTAAPYKIIHYGALSGFANNLTATLPYPGRYGFTVQDNPPYLQLAVTATLNGALLWHGGNLSDPTRWDVATTTNWLNGATPDKFIANDPVAFDDSALTNRATLVGSIVSPSLVASNNSLNYTVDGAGSLAVTTLGMQGTGGFTLANTAANALGNVVVFAGNLTIGNSAPNNLGNVALTNGTLTIANNGPNTFTSIAAAGGTLDFNQPTNVAVSASIVGSGTVVKDGANTLTLAANNSDFTGTLQVNSGVLKAGANNALGANNSGTVGSTATVDVNGFNIGNITLTLQGAGFGGRGAIDNSSGNAFAAFAGVVLAGDTTLGASAPGVEWDSVPATFAGNGFKVTKVGPGFGFLTPGVDTDIGDIEIKEGLLGFQSLGTVMGRPANTLTVRSNANLNFWNCLTAGSKEIVMDNEAIVSGGGGAGLFSGNMSINGKVHAIVSTGTTLTYSGTISGPGKLSRDWAVPSGGYPLSIGGVFELSGENTYTGGTEISAGVLRLSHNLALSTNQSVHIEGTNSGGFLNVNTPRLELAGGVVIPPGVTATFVPIDDIGARTDFYSASGANEWQGTIIARSNGPVELGGAAGTTLTISGPIIGTNFTGTLLIRSGGTFQGNLAGPINITADVAKTDGGTWTISSTSNQWTETTVAVGTLKLGTNDGLCVTAPLFMGQGDNNTATFDLNGFNQRIQSLTNVGNGTTIKRIANDSTVSDSVFTYAGGTFTNISVYSGVFMDAYSVGTMHLALTLESGVLVLNSANTHTGPTLVKSGAALAGVGSLNSAVTVESGGVLAPGVTIGTLTINSNLTLNAGCTNLFEISHSPLASDLVAGLINVTYGGTLLVTNIGVAPLAAGDNFTLFQAGTYSGGFSSILLPTLGAGLKWNTNNLAINGTLSVEATTPPNVDGAARLPDGNIQLTLSGPSGAGYSIHASTNVALPLSSWSIINSGTISTSPFTYSDLSATNFAQRFYRMSVP